MRKVKSSHQFWAILIPLLIILILSIGYFTPVLEGKEILQPDIVNHTGMAEEQRDFRQSTGEESYWTNAMFGGMPTYQLGARYSNDWVRNIDQFFRFLPRPADYLFLLLSGFSILGLTLFGKWKYALLGAVFFSFSTYFFIILGAGHNSKLHAIAYFAPLVAGVLLLYRGKYFLGFFLTALFLSLELLANHLQMTYYLLISLLIYLPIQGVYSLKEGEITVFIKATLLGFFACALALGTNYTRLASTYEYSQESIRGKRILESQTDLPALNRSYITAWSYGRLETLNLFIPNFMGGASSSPVEDKAHLVEALTEMAESQEELDYFQTQVLPRIGTYWGNQPFTAGPAYQGAIVIFLALLALFLISGPYKWWLLSATFLSIVLAWGKNFSFLTDFFIDYVPLYDKFRAVSSILVIAEFTLPLLAILGLYAFYTDKKLSQNKKKNKLMLVGIGLMVFLLVSFLFGESLYGLTSSYDASLPKAIQEAIVADRLALLRSDIIRTFFFIFLTFSALLLSLSKKVNSSYVLLFIGFLSILDLGGVDKRYLNNDNFVKKRWVKNPFPTEVSQGLLNDSAKNKTLAKAAQTAQINAMLAGLKEKDGSTYRVLNTLLGTFNEATTSKFHHSIGGYHGAKLRRYQDVIERYMVDSMNQNVLNLLNTKYLLTQSQERGLMFQENVNVLGNAWFVSKIHLVESEKEALEALSVISPKEEAYLSIKKEHSLYQKDLASQKEIRGTIDLISYQPNKLIYKVNTSAAGFSVFSEIYYSKGWRAYANGKEIAIIPTNYFLRGAWIPKGTTEIEMKFEPEVIQTGNTVLLVSNIIWLLLLFVSGGFWIKGGLKNRGDGKEA